AGYHDLRHARRLFLENAAHDGLPVHHDHHVEGQGDAVPEEYDGDRVPPLEPLVADLLGVQVEADVGELVDLFRVDAGARHLVGEHHVAHDVADRVEVP